MTVTYNNISESNKSTYRGWYKDKILIVKERRVLQPKMYHHSSWEKHIWSDDDDDDDWIEGKIGLVWGGKKRWIWREKWWEGEGERKGEL